MNALEIIGLFLIAYVFLGLAVVSIYQFLDYKYSIDCEFSLNDPVDMFFIIATWPLAIISFIKILITGENL
jgi:hypothetical protein